MYWVSPMQSGATSIQANHAVTTPAVFIMQGLEIPVTFGSGVYAMATPEPFLDIMLPPHVLSAWLGASAEVKQMMFFMARILGLMCVYFGCCQPVVPARACRFMVEQMLLHINAQAPPCIDLSCRYCVLPLVQSFILLTPRSQMRAKKALFAAMCFGDVAHILCYYHAWWLADGASIPPVSEWDSRTWTSVLTNVPISMITFFCRAIYLVWVKEAVAHRSPKAKQQ